MKNESVMEDETLKRLASGILRIRVVEERIAELYAEQQMRCPVHLCIGQEAVPVGVCAHLSPKDVAFGGHRSHGHYLAKGGDLKAMLAEIYGKADGCSGGKGGSMHLIDLKAGFLGSTPVVGSTIPIGVGAAYAAKLRGEKRVSVVFFGEGATEEGVFHESVNFAVLKALPVVFVCENNLYSVYSPLSVRQPKNSRVYELARGHGIESLHGDGNDVAQVYRLAGRAVAKARRGGGPTFIELSTYRWREHCGPNYDNDIGYRSESEFLVWKKRDPVARVKKAVAKLRGGRAWLALVERELAAEMEEAVAFAKASPFPPESDLLKDVVAESA